MYDLIGDIYGHADELVPSRSATTSRRSSAASWVEDWTTPRLVEMVITPDGRPLGPCDGQATFKAFLGASEDQNIHGVAPVAELDGDEIGFLVTSHSQGRMIF